MFCVLWCRQQDLLKKVVEIKPKRQKVASPSNGNQSSLSEKNVGASSPSIKTDGDFKVETTAQSLLGLAYASSDDEDWRKKCIFFSLVFT